MLAVETFIWDQEAVSELHRWLCCVGVQVDELLTWQDNMKVSTEGASGGPISDLPHQNHRLDEPSWER